MKKRKRKVTTDYYRILLLGNKFIRNQIGDHFCDKIRTNNIRYDRLPKSTYFIFLKKYIPYHLILLFIAGKHLK